MPNYIATAREVGAGRGQLGVELPPVDVRSISEVGTSIKTNKIKQPMAGAPALVLPHYDLYLPPIPPSSQPAPALPSPAPAASPLP